MRTPTPRSTGADRSASDAARIVSVLQYLASDYPAAIASSSESELAEQRSLASEALALAQRASLPEPLVARAAEVNAMVGAAAQPARVSEACGALVDALVLHAGIARAPTLPPDLYEGAALFSKNCAGCHGLTGAGNGPAASALSPRPANFHAQEVMDGLTPFKAFNAIRFGVSGTAMAPFDKLGERERWALAFYLFTLRQPACDHAPKPLSLDALANRSDAALGETVGAGEVPCVRRRLPELDPRALVEAARSRVDEASRLIVRGDWYGAERTVLDAYLTDIEPIEPWLRTRDPDAVTELEVSFTTARGALQAADPAAVKDVARLSVLLERAGSVRRTATRASVFWFSLLVIVREGFEAAVVIAALLAVLKKRKQWSRARWVHAGWVSAIAVGAVAFVLGRKVLAGAMNEKLEGALSLVAVAMLLHAALWLNARATTRRTMGTLRDKAKGALDRGALALFGIAFLAMFRESFETAVFLEALSIDAPSAVAWGSAAGTALLLALVFGASRLGVRLPMQSLFRASTAVLLVTAGMLLGQSIHSFEEVGVLPSRPMAFFRLEVLGIYPDRLGVLAQSALLALIIVWIMLSRSGAKSGEKRQASTHAV